MSTCIRDCDQRYMSAACAASAECVCSDSTVLQHVYQCVLAECSTETTPLQNAIKSACGAQTVSAMMQPLPAGMSTRTSSAIGTRGPASFPSDSTAPPPSSSAEPKPSSTSPPAESANTREEPIPSHSSSDAAKKWDLSSSASSSSRSGPSRMTSQDWFGGAGDTTLEAEQTPSKSDIFAQPSAGSDSALLANPSPSGSLGPTQADPPSGSDISSEANRTQSPASSGSLMGPAVGAVVGIIAMTLLAWICLRVRKRKLSRLEGRSIVSDPHKLSRSSFGENTGTMPLPWTDFGRVSPEPWQQPEKEELDEKHEREHGTRPDAPIQTIPREPQDPFADPLIDQPISPTRALYSQWHRTVAVPPPSMRSKRTSAQTTNTDTQTIETGIHTIDSNMQLAYPVNRPVSSSISFGFESPKKGPSTRASWATQKDSRIPETPPELSNEGSDAVTPALSRTSTMTDMSLGAVGRRSRYIGRAL